MTLVEKVRRLMGGGHGAAQSSGQGSRVLSGHGDGHGHGAARETEARTTEADQEKERGRKRHGCC